MSEHRATIRWQQSGDFAKGRFSREHTWTFDGGVTVPASAAPTSVPPPLSNPANVDPEEAFVASISSCHMLFFLSFAAKRGHVVESYRDEAVGVMGKNAEGRLAITLVTLRPHVQFSGDEPVAEDVAALHHAAHEACFIATSVKTEIRTDPTFEVS